MSECVRRFPASRLMTHNLSNLCREQEEFMKDAGLTVCVAVEEPSSSLQFTNLTGEISRALYLAANPEEDDELFAHL